MIENQPGTDWRDLQQRVSLILQESGLQAETGRNLLTARGTVEIDVYATDPATQRSVRSCYKAVPETDTRTPCISVIHCLTSCNLTE